MKLKVLGSSSKGNCYILENDKEALILEAGIALKHVKAALDFKMDKVVGVLITHAHGDHSKHAKSFIKAGIEVYATKGTLDKLDLGDHRTNTVPLLEEFVVGSYSAIAFDVKHDCAAPCGFLVRHNELGNMLFATDTYYLEYNFPDLNHVLIEANYSLPLLNQNVAEGLVHKVQKKRVIKSHFELENVKGFLQATDLSKIINIVLLHLSEQNSDEQIFKDSIQELTERSVFIANEGMEIDLNPDPF